MTAVTTPTPPAARRSVGKGVLVILLSFLFVAGGWLLVTEVGPGLRDDMAIRGQARPDPSVRLITGQCRSRLFLLQTCEVTLSWRGKDGAGTRKVHYLFVEPHAGDWNVVAVADPARPHLASTDLGIERITNRIITAIGMFVALLLLVVGTVMHGVSLIRGRAARA